MFLAYIFTMLVWGINLPAQDSTAFKSQHIQPYGYIRTGLGYSATEKEMKDFILPTAVHKFRLGNEANHYAEIGLRYSYQKRESARTFELNYLAASYTPYQQRIQFSSFQTAELYLKINKLFRNTHFWAGKRYYDRRNVDMLDFFWSNIGQQARMGLGIEHIPLKNGTLNLAAFEYVQDLQYQSQPYRHRAIALDIRLLDYYWNSHMKLNASMNMGYRPADSRLAEPSAAGFGLSIWGTYEKNKLSNTLTSTFRSGPLLTESGYSGIPVSSYINDIRQYNLRKAWDFTLVNNLVYDDLQTQAIQFATVFRKTDYGLSKPQHYWFSIGARYQYYLHRYFNLAVELGHDFVYDEKLAQRATLQKITFSPQITLKKGYYSRPVLRPFVTYAQGMRTGVNYGLQFEAWW